MKLKKLNLLLPDALVKTGDVDHADWNHKPVLGTISRARFHLIKNLLNERRGARLLEIGYGSGVFLPELSNYAGEIYGLDVHQKQGEVFKKLAELNIDAELKSGSAEKILWQENFFDFVVAVSALEFVSDLDAVCLEVKRILKPGGSFFVVTPGSAPLLDFGLKLLTGKNAREDFADRRETILPTLREHFRVKRELVFPKYGSSILKLYTALELQPKF